jgi:hypothetical protein
VVVEDSRFEAGEFNVLVDAGQVAIARSLLSESRGGSGLHAMGGQTSLSDSIVSGNRNGVAVFGAVVTLTRTLVEGSETSGVSLSPLEAGRAFLDDCVLRGNGKGLVLSAADTVTLSRTVITQNGTGIDNDGGGTLETTGTSVVQGNDADRLGTSTTVGLR